MMRILTVCACAMVAILLLSSDASACGKRRAACYVSSLRLLRHRVWRLLAPRTAATPRATAAMPRATAATPRATAAMPDGGYGYGGYDFGRPGYNPGGLGGPRSGLGVRPGVGFGGFGPRR